MQDQSKFSAFILGAFIFLGLSAVGYQLGNAAIQYKEYERTVTAKGLSEREYPADIVIWPIQFTESSNDLAQLYNSIEASNVKIKNFLEKIKSTALKYRFQRQILLINLHSNTVMPRLNFATQHNKLLPFTQKISS